jgi:predicted aspartyl protease
MMKGASPGECNLSRMGLFRIIMGVESPQQRGTVVSVEDTLVDTGSEATWVPRSILESLGVTVERQRSFIVADGRRIDRDIGYAIVHAGGTATIDEVVFAEETDFPILGAHSLEGLNLRVDPVRKTLVDAGPILAVSAA